jgi:methyl-accepting chemotaxis protein
MTARSTMKIGTKLGIGFGIVLLLLLVVSTLSILQSRNIEQLLKAEHDVRTQKMEQLYLVREALGQTGLAARNAYIFTSDADAAKELELLDQQKTIYLNALSQLEPRFDGDADFARVRKDLLRMAEELKRPRQYREAGKMEEFGHFLVNECSPLRRQIVAEIDVIIKAAQRSVEHNSQATEESIARSSLFILTISAIAIIIGAVVAVVITKGLLNQLGGEPNDVRSIASRIATGDLTVAIPTHTDDQSSVMFAMKEMRDSLAGIVAQIRTGTDTIASGSSQIASGNLDLSARTEQQASSLEETASSMEELTATVKQNAESAHQANDLACAASDIALKGGQVVSQVVQTMGSIHQSARKIADIISVIDGIAFQTNILALNAAVEAARAGEQGRGFAVVATEVRNLAQRSAAAAKEIKTLIEDSVSKVESGSQLVDQAGHTMEDIVGSIQRVNSIMGEIASASHEQISGISQINLAVNHMDESTQQNASLVEEAAAAAQSMQEQAQHLASLVSTFTLEPRAQRHQSSAPVTVMDKAEKRTASGTLRSGAGHLPNRLPSDQKLMLVSGK